VDPRLRMATRRHANKPKTWVIDRYYGKFNKFRNDRWVFGDITTGAYLVKFAWTGIVRHILVKGRASRDDPALTEYWTERRRRIKPPLEGYMLRLLTMQDGRCPLCGTELLSTEQPPQSPTEWERWWLQIIRKAIVADYLVLHGRSGPSDDGHTRLIHSACRREHHTRRITGTESLS
jgi:RNA-directed DNA polymerase